MKFTSEDLMKAMGLKVGDRIRCNKLLGTVFEVIKMDDGSIALDGLQTEWHSIHELIDKEIEILPAPKKIGDLKCSSEIKCENCPLRAICETVIFNLPIKLYDILKRYELNNSTKLDQEIYNLLMARLDRVVFERQDNMEVIDND